MNSISVDITSIKTPHLLDSINYFIKRDSFISAEDFYDLLEKNFLFEELREKLKIAEENLASLIKYDNTKTKEAFYKEIKEVAELRRSMLSAFCDFKDITKGDK